MIIPSENKKDLTEITENEILKNIEIHFVDNANEIIKKAFTSKITPTKNVGKKIVSLLSRISKISIQLVKKSVTEHLVN